MSRKLVQSVIVLLLIIFSLGSTFAPASAQGGDVTLKIDRIDASDMNHVKVWVTIRDENGVPLEGLTPDKFEIVENNITKSSRPLAVETHTNPDAIVSVALVIDLSRTMKGEPLKQAQEAIRQFLQNKNPKDPVALIAFGEEVSTDPTEVEQQGATDLVVDFTVDGGRIRNSSDFLTVQGDPKTPLYDAAVKAVLMTKSQPQGRRAVILMSDGYDIRKSKSQANDPITEAQRYNIPFFPIGLSTSKVNYEYLEDQLAMRTGGKYYEADTPADLTATFLEVQNMLKQQYVLEYKSAFPSKDNLASVMIRVDSAFDIQEFATPTPIPPTATSVPAGETVVSTPTEAATATSTPTPTPEPNTVEKIQNWVEDNPVPTATIGAVILLIIVLIVILIVIRRRSAPKLSTVGGEPLYGSPDEAYPPGGLTSGTPSLDPTRVGGPSSDGRTGPTDWASPSAQRPSSPTSGATAKQGVPGTAPPQGKTKIIDRRAMKPLATLIDAQDVSKSYPIEKEATIGRSDDNTITLKFKVVSRHHAKIKLEEGTFYVYDIQSSNGTFVDGQNVLNYGRLPLKDGSRVRFGEKEMVFRILNAKGGKK